MGLGLAFLISVSACTGGSGPPGESGTVASPVASGSSPSRDPSMEWRAITYSAGWDVWVFDRASGRTRNLTPDGQRFGQDSPRFLDDETIAYRQEGALYTIEWHDSSTPIRLPGTYGGSWDVDRGLAATEVTVQSGSPAYRETDYLEVREIGSGRPLWRTELRASVYDYDDETTGREQSYQDEQRVEWAPDGNHILVSDTLFYPNPKQTLFVVSREGEVVLFLEGTTYARWLDNDSVLFRSFNGDRWQLADVGTGNVGSLGAALGQGNPSVEPETKAIAFDTAGGSGRRQEDCTCDVVILDQPRGTGRAQFKFGAFPVWLSATELLVTEVQACRGSDCGVGAPMWESLKRSVIIEIGQGPKATLPFETFDGSTGYASPSVAVLRT